MHAGSLRAKLSTLFPAVFLAAALPMWAPTALAGDAERGRLLYENHCMVCHTSVVHVREDRKATTREEIRGWVERWQKELGLPWMSVDVDDVVEFLNNRYYQLKSDS
jgi:cytochrome c5